MGRFKITPEMEKVFEEIMKSLDCLDDLTSNISEENTRDVLKKYKIVPPLPLINEDMKELTRWIEEGKVTISAKELVDICRGLCKNPKIRKTPPHWE
jgi:hypothetical protein